MRTRREHNFGLDRWRQDPPNNQRDEHGHTPRGWLRRMVAGQQQKQLVGTLTNSVLAVRTLGSAKFITGTSFIDIGNGMVQAPQA